MIRNRIIKDVNYQYTNFIDLFETDYKDEVLLTTIGRVTRQKSTDLISVVKERLLLTYLYDNNKHIPIIFLTKHIPKLNEYVLIFGRLKYDLEKIHLKNVEGAFEEFKENVNLSTESQSQPFKQTATNKVIIIEFCTIIKDEEGAKKMQTLYDNIAQI